MSRHIGPEVRLREVKRMNKVSLRCANNAGDATRDRSVVVCAVALQQEACLVDDRVRVLGDCCTAWKMMTSNATHVFSIKKKIDACAGVVQLEKSDDTVRCCVCIHLPLVFMFCGRQGRFISSARSCPPRCCVSTEDHIHVGMRGLRGGTFRSRMRGDDSESGVST